MLKAIAGTTLELRPLEPTTEGGDSDEEDRGYSKTLQAGRGKGGPCATVTPFSSVVIGAIAGVVVVLSVLFFDKIKVDDPVGAISVHGVCGAAEGLDYGEHGASAYPDFQVATRIT